MTASPVPLRRSRVVGIVLPIHDEEQLLAEALEALEVAVEEVPGAIRCHTVLVFDDCRDQSWDIAASWTRSLGRRHGAHSVDVIEIGAGNVGSARWTGCANALEFAGQLGVVPAQVWLATTDADSTVPAQWLVTQLASHDAGTDLWSGTVSVRDWRHRQSGTAAEWGRLYSEESTPAHGASLGVNGQVYLDAGQFQSLASGEDRALLDAVIDSGARYQFDRSVPVVTSARQNARAPGGFADALGRIERTLGSANPLADLDDVSA